MQIGNIIRKRREQIGISRSDLARRMAEHGMDFPKGTIQYWEDGKLKSETSWNSDFIIALAKSLEMAALELLSELGFPTGLPEYISPEDIALIELLNAVPEEERDRLKRLILAWLEEAA